MAHFAPNLQPRGKWFKVRENLSVGDIVLVIDKDVPRSKWIWEQLMKFIQG